MIEQVPLVGEKTAKAIVAHRQRKAQTMGQRGEVDQAAACRPIQNCEESLWLMALTTTTRTRH